MSEQEKQQQIIDNITLEFLLNKTLYKKVMGNNHQSKQEIRETEERNENKIKYKSELIELIMSLLENRQTNIPVEIENVFDAFIDKSASFIIRQENIINGGKKGKEEREEDEEDEDEDDD